jgi:hypothetical protein
VALIGISPAKNDLLRVVANHGRDPHDIQQFEVLLLPIRREC